MQLYLGSSSAFSKISKMTPFSSDGELSPSEMRPSTNLSNFSGVSLLRILGNDQDGYDDAQVMEDREAPSVSRVVDGKFLPRRESKQKGESLISHSV